MSAWLSAAHAAKYLGFSYEYFRRLVVAGKIKSRRHGARGSYCFRQEWLDDFLGDEPGELTDLPPTLPKPSGDSSGECEYGLPS